MYERCLQCTAARSQKVAIVVMSAASHNTKQPQHQTSTCMLGLQVLLGNHLQKWGEGAGQRVCLIKHWTSRTAPWRSHSRHQLAAIAGRAGKNGTAAGDGKKGLR
jgi:hypothetical protein